MGEASDAELVVRRLLGFIDRGVLSAEAAIIEAYGDAISVTPYNLGHPGCARVFNDRMGALIEACAQATGEFFVGRSIGRRDARSPDWMERLVRSMD